MNFLPFWRTQADTRAHMHGHTRAYAQSNALAAGNEHWPIAKRNSIIEVDFIFDLERKTSHIFKAHAARPRRNGHSLETANASDLPSAPSSVEMINSAKQYGR